MATIQPFDTSVDLLQALLWEYNNAPNLEALLTKKQAWVNANQSEFWNNWLRDVFDLRTANSFGLTVWAIILDSALFTPATAPTIRDNIFGFGSPNTGFGERFGGRFSKGGSQSRFKNFNNGNFGTGGGGGIAGLTVEQSRLLLRLRYFCLTMRPTVPNINAFINELFADYGKVAVIDNLDMTATYGFTFPLPSLYEYIFTNFDVLPRPAGVEVNITQAPTRKVFGFGEFNTNFYNANFGAQNG